MFCKWANSGISQPLRSTCAILFLCHCQPVLCKFIGYSSFRLQYDCPVGSCSSGMICLTCYNLLLSRVSQTWWLFLSCHYWGFFAPASWMVYSDSTLKHTGALFIFAFSFKLWSFFSAKSSHMLLKGNVLFSQLTVSGKIKFLNEENPFLLISRYASTCAGPQLMLCEG